MIDFDFRPEIVVVDSLPGEKRNPKIFFEIRDDYEIKLKRFPRGFEVGVNETDEELESCKGKIYCVLNRRDYECFVYDHGEWHLIGRYAFNEY